MSQPINPIVLLLLGLTLSACAAHPNYTIKSSTPAYIEIDGVIICESTPCNITPPHYVRPFGECAAGSIMNSILAAFPIDKSKGYVQHKQIKAGCDDNKTVYFDMQTAAGIQTIPTGMH